jgi:hypothetical protein
VLSRISIDVELNLIPDNIVANPREQPEPEVWLNSSLGAVDISCWDAVAPLRGVLW